MVQGSRTCTSAVTNISRQKIPSTATKQLSKLQQLSRCRKQIPCIVTTVTVLRDLNPTSAANCHLRKQNKLPSMRRRHLHPCKMSKSGHNTCKHYRMSLSFILSCSNVYIRVQALRRHAGNAWRLRMKQDIRYCVNITYLGHVAIVTARDG